MKKIKITILISSLLNLIYVLIYFGLKMTELSFVDTQLSYLTCTNYLPILFSTISLLLFIIELLKFKKINWFYFFIISLNIFTHILSFYFFTLAFYPNSVAYGSATYSFVTSTF